MKILTIIFMILLYECGTSGTDTSENNKTKQQKNDEKTRAKEQSEELKNESDKNIGEDELEPEEEVEFERIKEQEEGALNENLEQEQIDENLKDFTLKIKGFDKDDKEVITEMNLNLSDLYKKPGILIARSYQVSYITLNSDKEFILEKLDGTSRLFNDIKIEKNSNENSYKINLTGKVSGIKNLEGLPKNLIIKIKDSELKFTLFKFPSNLLKNESLQDRYIIKK